MNKTLKKMIRRLIQASKGRFLSLTAIVLIGTAFFIGVSATAPVMSDSVWLYRVDCNTKDLSVYAKYGFDDEDILNIKDIEGVDLVEGTKFVDVIATSETKSVVTRVHSYDPSSTMNQFVLVEGHLPNNKNEVLVEKGIDGKQIFQLDDTITLARPDGDLDDFISVDRVKVVGRIDTPLYLNNTKEPSSLSNSSIITYMYLPSEDFDIDVYNEVNIIVKNRDDYDSFSDAYYDDCEIIKKRIEDKSSTLSKNRYNSIKQEVNDKIQEGEDEYNKAKSDFDQEIKKANDKIEEETKKLVDAEEKIKDGEQEVFDAEVKLPNEIKKNREDLDTKKQELTTKKEEVLQQKQQLEEVLQQYGSQALKEMSIQLEAIDKGLTEIEDGLSKIAEGYEKIDQEEVKGYQKIKDAKQEISDNKQKILDGKVKLNDARKELEDAKQKGEKELADAKKKIDDGKKDIEDLEENEWIVLDPSEHYATETYHSTIEQMKAIAAIFPIFFLMVAALVCLTTITRMIQEQRGQMGVLRALGYSKKQCAGIYLRYAAYATLIGEVVGVVIGLLTFPKVIYETWKLMYILPPMQMVIPWRLIGITCLLFIAVMLFTTHRVVSMDLKDATAQLMRPKAPKMGKKILLEKMPVIWNKVSFQWKVTLRNLFRYKKRFYMTILGVAGCTALLVTGFGIKDSVSTMTKLQFDEIYNYDGMVHLKKDLSKEEKQEAIASVSNNAAVDDTTLAAYYTAIVKNDAGKEETARVEVYATKDDLYKNYTLRKRNDHSRIYANDTGVIISEHLSENLNLHKGDHFAVESNDGTFKDVVISDICEMYVDHYVFMDEAMYQDVFKEDLAMNTLLIKTKEDVHDMKDFERFCTNMNSVEGVSFHDTLLNNFETMVDGLDIVILTLIISSMSLAFVVLSNLMNVNISERFREIATLKVLGFYPHEVESYIYKENNILVLLGGLLGLPIGKILHYYIMHQVELDHIIYGRKILFASYGISLGLTILFGVIVDLWMRKKLRDIKMVESLKSVE